MQLNRPYISLLILMWFFKCIPAFSQDSIPVETIRMRQITVDDGLSQGFVYDGLQDKEGFIWLATMDGLNRYDGYNFTVYKHDPENPYSIPENSINCIAEDNNGNLWIGTMSKGLYIMDKRTERFYPVPIASVFNKNNSYNISRIICRQNLLYLKTAAGMIIIQTSMTGVGNYGNRALKDQVHVLQSIPLTGENDLIIDAGRDYFANKAYGVLEVFRSEKNHTNWTKKIFTAKDLGLESIDNAARFLLLDSINSLLIFNLGHIYLHSFEKKKTELLASYGENFVYAIKLLENKVYSCGYEKNTGNILYEFDINSKALKKYHAENNARMFVPMFKDRTGLLWIKTDAVGVCLLNPQQQAFKTAQHLGRWLLGTKNLIINPYNGSGSAGIFEFFTKDRSVKKLFSTKVFEQEKETNLFDFVDHQTGSGGLITGITPGIYCLNMIQ